MAEKYDENSRRPEDVKRLFNNIAPSYDRLNRIVSFGLDKGWRREVAHETWEVECENILDVCAGSGDLSLELHRFWKGQAHIDALDFSKELIEAGRRKVEEAGVAEHISFIEGDALAMPFDDESYDALTIGFGFRNLQDRKKALAEFLRVLQPGGLLVVLEVTQPRRFLRPLYYLYMLRIVPFIAAVMRADKEAYKYLGRTIRAFPDAPEFAEMIKEAGFQEVKFRRLGLGTVAIHTGYKQA
ncbi:MAG: bifunctional demethylmenaquinone methyltransferase/2-methoxy-6-polyprenyl-1,4-benzoquinol methylase UbiE [Actinomycetota bacterium]